MNLTLDSSIFVMLSPKEVTYQGAVDLAQYYVKNTTMSAEEELVVVKVTLMKKYMNLEKTEGHLGTEDPEQPAHSVRAHPASQHHRPLHQLLQGVIHQHPLHQKCSILWTRRTFSSKQLLQ